MGRVMLASDQKKTARLLGAGGFFGLGKLSLAGAFRQKAVEKAVKEEPVAHRRGLKHTPKALGKQCPYFGHNTICVHRKSATFAPLPSTMTSASQTWVLRPR